MKLFVLAGLLALAQSLAAQELYVATEPASNMPTRSMAIRLSNKLMPMKQDTSLRIRNKLEVMVGVSKKLMLHASIMASDVYTSTYRVEGGSFYAKYRFFSEDDVHSHLRMAAFGRVSYITNPPIYQSRYKYFVDHGTGPVEHTGYTGHVATDIDLDGNNAGWETGLIVTQLKQRLAVSSTVSFTQVLANAGQHRLPEQPRYGFNYSASAGYLLLPKEYVNFRQTNVNLYAELLGTVLDGRKGSYADVVPAIQFIFNSIARVDVGARFNVWGNVHRMGKQSYLLRLEYNFLNVFKKKKQ